MKSKKIVLLSIVLLIVGFVVASQFYQKSIDKKTEQLAANKAGAPFVREHSPSFGENKNQVMNEYYNDLQNNLTGNHYRNNFVSVPPKAIGQ